MRTALKRSLVWGYCHGLLGARLVAGMFKKFQLGGA